MIKYNQSPLPFQGQKRRFLKTFTYVLKDSYSSDNIYVDLFGGSGLLSHTVKYLYPKATVIYNDFDDFHKRLDAVESTNHILDELRKVLKGYPRQKRVTGKHREAVLSILKQAESRADIDWITLSSSLLFSANIALSYPHFIKKAIYNNVALKPYKINGYLQGAERVKMDYQALFEQYKHTSNVVLLVDPPYLSTDNSTYMSNKYWKLKDFLDVLQVLDKQNYFYFTSNKSHVVELCSWIENRSKTLNPLANATRFEIKNTINNVAKYTDIMYHYKRK